MHHVPLPRIATNTAWRQAARRFLHAGVPPEDITWGGEESTPGLFASDPLPEADTVIKVPRAFAALAETVVWHNDPSRFSRLYAFLWRLRAHPELMTDRGDPGLAVLRRMEKNVHRCKHKMKAFVRFREIGGPRDPRRSFAAWFEPTHHTVEPTAPFFARRFADMDWRIVTPDVTAIFQNGKLSFSPGQEKPPLPEDAEEHLWTTYFRNIFNPARLKVAAMRSEMPRKYWHNLPEARAIPELVADAPRRAAEMAAAAPTLPPANRVAAARSQAARHASAWSGPAGDLPAAIRACTACPLHCNATQAVPGEGPTDAPLMIVAEQPGDEEDLHGRPLIGPAGRLFREISEAVDLDLASAYLTNAVKHFKFTAKGRRRIHKRPSSGDIEACHPWLKAELALVAPRAILALGSTATGAVTGTSDGIETRRGTVETGIGGIPVLITYHPAFLLRHPDPNERTRCRSLFLQDLRKIRAMIAAPAG